MTAAADSARGPELPSTEAARSRPPRTFVFGSPAAIVFGGAPRSWSHVLASSSAATFLLYALAGLALSRADWQRTPKVVPPPLMVELLEPPPPPPPPVPEPEPPPPPEPPPVAKPAKVVERVVEKAPPPPPADEPPPPSDEPPPPAEAGQVVAADPDAPADFTNFDITSGQGARYRGGVTAASGTNTRAVHSPVVDRAAAPAPAARTVSLAQPVRLEVRNWECPWPEQADLLAVDEERVELKVDVDAQGRVTAATLLSDPGYGFGAAALRCARQHRFLPATDVAGRPITASSPPIRVRFSR